MAFLLLHNYTDFIKIMHYQHTLKFASKSYFHNFRVNHTQDQSLSDNTHDFNDKIHVKPIDKK